MVRSTPRTDPLRMGTSDQFAAVLDLGSVGCSQVRSRECRAGPDWASAISKGASLRGYCVEWVRDADCVSKGFCSGEHDCHLVGGEM